MLEKIAMLRKKYNKNTKQTEWALLSRSKPHRVLKWFGARKPSKERVQEEEKRVQYFKHATENVISELHNVSGELRAKGIVHIADALTNCILSLIRNSSQEENAIRLGKIINILQKKGESTERLSSLLPDIIACKEVEVNKFIEVDEEEFQIRISALRAYNIAKLLKEKYLSGCISSSDFEYRKMRELETLLKTGFIMPMPINYNDIPDNVSCWWDHFEKENGE